MLFKACSMFVWLYCDWRYIVNMFLLSYRCFKEYGKFLESRQVVALNSTSQMTDGFNSRIFVKFIFELVTEYS